MSFGGVVHDSKMAKKLYIMMTLFFVFTAWIMNFILTKNSPNFTFSWMTQVSNCQDSSWLKSHGKEDPKPFSNEAMKYTDAAGKHESIWKHYKDADGDAEKILADASIRFNDNVVTKAGQDSKYKDAGVRRRIRNYWSGIISNDGN
jgi:hypothetical protein